MKLTPLTGTATRWAAALLVATGLTIGVGTQPAAADDSEETPDPPRLISLRLEGTDAYVTFRDNSDHEVGFVIFLRERDHPDRRIALRTEFPGGAPGKGREATRSISGIPPDIAFCATVSARGSEQETVVFIVGIPIPVTLEPGEDESNAVCADPAVQALAPDLVLVGVRGQAEREWAVARNQTPAYLVAFRNEGGDAEGTVVVEIATSGVLTLADQTAVRPGWEAAGFTCVTTPPSGGANAGLRCTGGSLQQGQATNPAILVRATGPGYGYIHASIGVSGDADELDTGDNRQTLGVRIH